MSGKSITLTLREEAGLIELGGDLDTLHRDRRMLMSLKRIDPDYNPEKHCVGLGDKKPHTLLLDLHEAFQNRGYEDASNDAADNVLNRYYAEEKAFSEFSEKARRIRNNDCDPEDFAAFSDCLARCLPGRFLYPLQLLSAYHLAFSQNACNFSVPGAGKTTVVYGAYTYLKNLPEDDLKHVDCILVVGPLSCFGPWEDEFEACYLKPACSMRLDGSKDLQARCNYLLSDSPEELTLVNYNSLDNLVVYLQAFLSQNKTLVVLDEAHKIKNVSGGVWSTAALSLAPHAKGRVVLTGTPAPNGYEDLYNLFEFIWPQRNVSRFQVNQLTDMSRSEEDPRIPQLLEYIEPYYLRIRKSDLNLPEVDNKPLQAIPLSPLHQEIYDGVERLFVESIMEGDCSDDRSRRCAFAKIVRLMQAATYPPTLLSVNNDPEIDLKLPESLEEAIRRFAKEETPLKFLEAEKLVRKVMDSGGKIIIWCHFVSTLSALAEYLTARGIQVKLLYGDTPVGDIPGEENDAYSREGIIREFNDPSSSLKVVIANPAAVAESISLHHACHNALYLERSFNAAQYLQSRDRIHRYGLDGDVKTVYYKYAAANTIDEVIEERLNLKEERMMRIVESTAIPLFENVEDGLGVEDIKALIRDYVKRTNRI